MAKGKETPISQGLIARITSATGNFISSIRPDSWFSPSQPVPAQAPESVRGRAFDFPVGTNLTYTPRTGAQVNFTTLRAFADYDLVRMAIETCKDQLEGLDWSIRPRDKALQKQKGIKDAGIDEITEFFQSPDKEHSWGQWLRAAAEDFFVLDALSIYRRPNRGGKLYALELLDGATIKPLIDQTGRSPIAPDPAYQQILKGLPAVDYSRDELLYAKRNVRTNSVYGFPPVEHILNTIITGTLRNNFVQAYYTEGNLPDALLTAPVGWDAKKIEAWQMTWDAMLSGNNQNRRHGRWVPDSTKVNELKQPPLKDQYDEWIARIVCYCFSLPHDAFVQQVNRATAETSGNRATKEGLETRKKFFKDIFDKVIRENFGRPDLEWSWVSNNEDDPEKAARLGIDQVKAGIIDENEERERLGLPPMDEEKLAASRAMRQPKLMMQGQNEEKKPPQKKTQKHDHGDLEKGSPPSLDGIHAQTGYQLHLKSELKKKISNVLAATEKSVIKQIGESAFFKKEAPVEVQKRKTRKPENVATDESVSVTIEGATMEAIVQPSPPSASALDAAETLVLTIDLSAQDKLASQVTHEIEEAAKDGGTRALALVGVKEREGLVNQVNQRAVAYAQARSAEMVGMRRVGGELIPNPNAEMVVSESTREQLRQIIAGGLQDNVGKDGIVQRILESTTFSPERAELIANTEIGNANSAGVLDGFRAARDLGLKVKKIWLVDDEPCVICEINAAQGAIDLDDEFPSGDLAPLAHPNCECSITSSIQDEE